ncbi:hypothetical protein CO676_20945 [Sinorhizobium sp. BJ1]|nr:hypothetical protein CO676_20945 [Sinorhizobium sp. BJ1]
MSYERQQTLLSEADLVKRAEATVPRMLAHPAITLDQVTRLRGHIDECIERLGNLVAEMELVGADRLCLQAAEVILRAWRGLAYDAAEREQSLESAPLEVQEAPSDRTGGSQGAKAEYHA